VRRDPGDHAVIDGRTVTSSAVVAAPPAEVFALLANPHRHHEFDGSGTVRAAVSGPQRLALGDRFGMRCGSGCPTGSPTGSSSSRRTGASPGATRPARSGATSWSPSTGGTRITETFDFRGSPVARGIELAGMHRNNARSIRDTLRRLRQIFGTP
jgi:hypothetical protein